MIDDDPSPFSAPPSSAQGGGGKPKSLQELLAAKRASASAPSTATSSETRSSLDSFSVASLHNALDELPVGGGRMSEKVPVTRSYDEDSFTAKSPAPSRARREDTPPLEPAHSLSANTPLPLSALSLYHGNSGSSEHALDSSAHPVVHSTGLDIEEEEEMPSSSFSVIGDDADLLKLLAGASVPFAPPPPSSASPAQDNEELIELYSAIAVLKRENAELQKEVELASKSKDALLVESQQRHEQHAQRLKLELHEQQQVNVSLQRENDELRRDLDMMRADINALVRQKEEVEQNAHRRQDDSSSLKAELQSLKTELNKQRMENARAKSDFEDLLHDKQQMLEELQTLRRQLREDEQRHEDAMRDLQSSVRRLEETNLAIKNELGEKNAHIGRMTTDWMSLDRNFKHAVADVEALKQRNSALEASERELQQVRYQFSSLENDYRSLQNEFSALRQQYQQLQQQQLLQVQVQNRSYAMPPPPTPPPPLYRSDPPSLSAYAPSSNRTGASSYASPSLSSPYAPSPSPSLSSFAANRYDTSDFETHSQRVKNAPKSLSSALGGAPSSAPSSSGGSSLANLLQGRKQNDDSQSFSITGDGGRRRNPSQMGGGPAATPFATEKTNEMMSSFDTMERDLTRMMTEKTTLTEESERLQVRGLKSLADRSRMQKIESRLEELSKEISYTRKRLSGKPA